MIITEPYAQIESAPKYHEALAAVEFAARTCYKSELSDNAADAERFIRSVIKRGHESVLEHFSVTVRFVCDRGISHELVRHRIASFCVSGDTVIRSLKQKSWTIRQLYEWQNDLQRKGRLKLMHVRSVDEDSMTVVPNRIGSITYMGNKPVYELTTESGRKIKCTEDHRILCKEGWRPLGEIEIGDFVCANGRELLENPDWLRYYYLEQNHTRKETAQAIGCCESYVYRAFQKFGIRKPWSDMPNRKPGRGKKGAMSEEGRRKLSELHKGGKNKCYKPERRDLTGGGGYSEAIRRYGDMREKCEFCGATDDVEIHHINKQEYDNRKANIKMLCPRCHHLWHKPGTIGVFYDKVVNVQYVGVEDVYDMSMASDIHNFVANGIVVHNCQESSRFCNYANGKFGSEITVIKPHDLPERGIPYYLWLEACRNAEETYNRLVNSGVKPETARSVLPTSLKTEVVMTANLREWRHFLKLRSVGVTGKPHPDMKLLADDLLRQFKERLPVFFEDIAPTTVKREEPQAEPKPQEEPKSVFSPRFLAYMQRRGVFKRL